MVSSVITIVFLVFCLGGVSAGSEDEIRINCEPKFFNTTLKSLTRRYNLPDPKTTLFISRIVHLSKRIYPNVKPGYLDILHDGMNPPRANEEVVNVKMTGHFEPLREYDMMLIYHFYFGDSFVCHQFNPWTGEYKRIELGFHTLNHYIVMEAGMIYTIVAPRHQDEEIVFLGVTFARKRTHTGDTIRYTEEEALEKFPQHHAIIREIYSNL